MAGIRFIVPPQIVVDEAFSERDDDCLERIAIEAREVQGRVPVFGSPIQKRYALEKDGLLHPVEQDFSGETYQFSDKAVIFAKPPFYL